MRERQVQAGELPYDMKYIYRINGSVVKARGDEDIAMQSVVLVGEERLIGEVIGVDGKEVTIQVYETTSGLKPGEPVVPTHKPLSVKLGPGILGNIFDGIQRPLEDLYNQTGAFLSRGVDSEHLNTEKKWHFTPRVSVGDSVRVLSPVGEVPETSSIVQKIMIPYGVIPEEQTAEVVRISPEGEYTIQ